VVAEEAREIITVPQYRRTWRMTCLYHSAGRVHYRYGRDYRKRHLRELNPRIRHDAPGDGCAGGQGARNTIDVKNIREGKWWRRRQSDHRRVRGGWHHWRWNQSNLSDHFYDACQRRCLRNNVFALSCCFDRDGVSSERMERSFSPSASCFRLSFQASPQEPRTIASI
jgi:hypothetical protein